MTASTATELLSGKVRALLVAFGFVLVGLGVFLWISPVQHSTPAPASAKCTDAKTCFVEVDDAPELLLSSLVVLGALLVLVGANGRVVTKFTGPGDLSFETATAAKAAEKAADEVTARVPAEKQAAALVVATAKARSGALDLAEAQGRRLTDSELDQVATNAVTATIKSMN